jgi:regulator of sigma D
MRHKVYTYTDHDLIEKPITYEFSAYKGKAFLEAYETERNGMIEYCQKNLTAMRAESRPVTNHVFADLWQKAQNKALGEKDEEALLVYIRKFEVTKKVFSEYDRHTHQRIGDDCGRVWPYLLFGNTLAAYIDFAPTLEKKAIAFNALLKVSDTISSVRERLDAYNEFEMALSLLLRERAIYKSFLGRKVIDNELCRNID